MKRKGIIFNKNVSISTNSKNANLVEKEVTKLVAIVSEMELDMVTEIHMAAVTKSNDLWLHSGATVHVCNNMALFKIYSVLEKPENVLIGNDVIAKLMEKGSVELNFTLG